MGLALVVMAAAPGPAAAITSTVRTAGAVSVRPISGLPHTRFVVSFRAPASTALGGFSEPRYSVAASGPYAVGCDSSAVSVAGVTKQRQLVRVTLAPRGSGWCAGTYHGVVNALSGPVCPSRTICPLFIAALRSIGRFTFRVR